MELIWRWLRSFWHLAFHNDVFVAYCRNDDHGGKYAHALSVELDRRGLAPLMDMLEARPSPETPEPLLEALEFCSQLIVVASSGAIDSPEVGKEVARFPKRGRSIILVQFERLVTQAAWYREHLSGLPAVQEGRRPAASALEVVKEQDCVTVPSSEVVDLIENAFRFKRLRNRLAGSAALAGLIIAGAGGASAFLGWRIIGKNEQLRQVHTTLIGVQTSLSVTENQRQSVENDLVDKSKKLVEANHRKEIADQAAGAARKRAEVATAEADRESRIALARKLANEANLIRDRDAASLEGSLLYGLESVALEHSGIADLAVRGSLNLLRPNAGAFPNDDSYLWRHDGFNRLRWSPDGKYLVASGLLAGTLLIHPASKRLETLDMDKAGAMAFTASDELATVHDGVVRFWRGWRDFTPKCDHEVAHAGDHKWAELNDTATHLIVPNESDVRIYDLQGRGKPEVLTVPAGKKPSLTVALSRNASLAAASCSDGAIAVWRTNDPTHPRVLNTGMSSIFADLQTPWIDRLAFSPKSHFLAAAVENAALVWDLERDLPPKVLPAASAIKAVAWSPDESLLATGGIDKLAHVWNLDEAREIARLPHFDRVDTITFNPDGTVLGSADTMVRLWRRPEAGTDSTVRWKRTISGHALSPFGNYAAVDIMDALLVYRLSDGRVTKLPHQSNGISSVAFSADESAVAISNAGQVDAWRIGEDGHAALMFVFGQAPALDAYGGHVAGDDGHGFGVFSLGPTKSEYRCGDVFGRSRHSLSPDGRTAVGVADGTLAVCDSSGTRNFRSGTKGQHVWSRNGKYFAIVGDDFIRIFESGKWTKGIDIPVGTHPVFLFRPDSRAIAVLSGIVTPHGQRPDKGRRGVIAYGQLPNLDNPVRIPLEFEPVGAAFAADGSTIAIHGGLAMAEVWNLRSRARIAQVAFEEPLLEIGFCEDQRFLIGMGRNSASRLLWRDEDLKIESCALLTRNLSPAELSAVGASTTFGAHTCPNLPVNESER